jgi:lycopene cyclase domain-containing protein
MACIPPFMLVNGLFTAIPIIQYDSSFICGIYLFTIPLEDFFYSFLYLLMVIGGYDLLKSRIINQQNKDTD